MRLFKSLSDASPDRLEVRGYRVGDLASEREIYLARSAQIAGNVTSPSLIVDGFLFGFAAAKTITVERHGQIWGDVYCSKLEILPGGKVHGWISTLDDGTLGLLRAGEVDFRDLAETLDIQIPEGLREKIEEFGFSPETDDERISRLRIWHQLQAEAGAALMARSEIEALFDQRPLVGRTPLSEADKAGVSAGDEAISDLENSRALRELLKRRNQHIEQLQMELVVRKGQVQELEMKLQAKRAASSDLGELEALVERNRQLEAKLQELEADLIERYRQLMVLSASQKSQNADEEQGTQQ